MALKIRLIGASIVCLHLLSMLLRNLPVPQSVFWWFQSLSWKPWAWGRYKPGWDSGSSQGTHTFLKYLTFTPRVIKHKQSTFWDILGRQIQTHKHGGEPHGHTKNMHNVFHNYFQYNGNRFYVAKYVSELILPTTILWWVNEHRWRAKGQVTAIGHDTW